MQESFEFYPLELGDIEKYAESSNVFNMTKGDIEKEKVMLASFSDEKLGSSIEKLDVAIKDNGEWKLLDIEDMIEGYNEIPLGYVLREQSYSEVMVILRRMSSMLLDKVRSGVSTYIYYKADNAKKFENNPGLIGMLASNKIRLDGSKESKDKMCSLGIWEEVVRLTESNS